MNYEPSKLDKLPKDEIARINAANCKVVRSLIAARLTVPQIARNAGMEGPALRETLRRDGNNDGVPRLSAGLRRLTAYILADHLLFPSEARAAFAEVQECYAGLVVEEAIDHESEQYQTLVSFGYTAILEMLGVPPSVAAVAYQKLDGDYLCYRWSIYEGDILVSRLSIAERAQSGGAREFRTRHYDTMGEPKESDGIVVPMGNNIYMAGDMEKGQGLDIFTFQEPFRAHPTFVAGFQISLDNERRPFFTRTLLVRIPEETEIDDGMLRVRKMAEVAKDNKGRDVVAFFERDPAQGVIRIDLRDPDRRRR